MVDLAAPFNPLIAANLAPPPNPLATAGQIVGVQNQMLANQTGKYDLATKQNDYLNAQFGALLQKPDLNHDDFVNLASNLIQKGIVPSEVAARELANVPQPIQGDPNGTLKQYQQFALDHLDKIETVQQQLDQHFGVPTQSNLGNRLVTNNVRQQGGVYATGGPNGSQPLGLSPEGAASAQDGPVDPQTGRKTVISKGEFAESRGLAPPGTYTGNNGGAIPVSVGRNGQIVPRKTGAVMSPSAVPPAGAPGGFGSDTSATMPPAPMSTEPSPAQSVVLNAAGNQYADAIKNQGTYAQQMQQLNSALTGLQNTTTGPGTEARQAIASYMLALPGGVGAYLPGVDPKSIAAYDEANKYLTQTASGTPTATRSDAGLNTALASSPSVHISNSAAQDVLKANIGFRRAEMANTAAFTKTGLDPSQFLTFLAQRQQTIDPRAYSVDLLSQPQRQAFLSSLPPAEKTKFLGSVRDAIANKIIDPRSLQGGSPGGQ